MSDKKLDRFIVFEGLDGSGKSTQARMLARHLVAQGASVHLTAEPTDRPIGTLVRSVLRHQVTTTSRALALLYAADRSDHLYNGESGILKSLDEGSIVISDRYFYSSIAYQSVECDPSFILSINRFPLPQVIVFIDTPVDVCMERIEKRGGEKELFDRASFLSKVRDNYIAAFSSLPEGVRLITVDGALSEEEV